MRWPELFCNPPNPLAIGILDKLTECLEPEEGKKWVKNGIGAWCNRIVYKKALAKGGPRYGLDGVSGEVAPDEQEHAKQGLSDYKQRKVVISGSGEKAE